GARQHRRRVRDQYPGARAPGRAGNGIQRSDHLGSHEARRPAAAIARHVPRRALLRIQSPHELRRRAAEDRGLVSRARCGATGVTALLMAKASVAFPPLPGRREPPQWTGRGFLVGQDRYQVLAYGATSSGWTDHLTDVHEAAAGADHFIDLASRRHAV